MNLSKLQELVKDREAWRAAVYGVTKNRIWLSDWIELKEKLIIAMMITIAIAAIYWVLTKYFIKMYYFLKSTQKSWEISYFYYHHCTDEETDVSDMVACQVSIADDLQGWGLNLSWFQRLSSFPWKVVSYWLKRTKKWMLAKMAHRMKEGWAGWG